jgi:hypothetical protein
VLNEHFYDSLIVFVNGLDIGCSGYHTLQNYLTHAVTSYGAF